MSKLNQWLTMNMVHKNESSFMCVTSVVHAGLDLDQDHCIVFWVLSQQFVQMSSW